MGWYEKGSQKDPVQQLDSDLREFLEQETPDKYVPAPDVSTSHATAPSPSSTQFSGFSDDAAHSEPKVPAASLFQDGRYAHLWKTYKPPTGIDTQTSFTTGEGVVQRYRERANSVKSAAMENCVVENEALLLCAKTGSWKEQMKSRVTACSAERRNFSRCFELQSVRSSIQALDACRSRANNHTEIPHGSRLRRIPPRQSREGGKNPSPCRQVIPSNARL